MTKWEWFREGFFHIRYILDCYETVEHFPDDFWEALSWGWCCEYIYPYDDPYNLTISPERRLRLAQELPKINLSVEDYDALVEKINQPPDPEVVEAIKKVMNKKAPWDD
jgi:hypothetical protein